jgi:predicted membrane-bound spermidine synthase
MAIFIILGITASIYQLVLLREFTFSIAKNELSLVVAIGAWIIFCSLGSLAGRKKRFLKLDYLPLLYSLIFFTAITLIHSAKRIIGLSYYEMASFGFIAAAALIFFGAMGFLVGYSFSLFSQNYLDQNIYSSSTFAKFFGWEALGFFVGGIVFTFFLASYRNPFAFSVLPFIFYFFILTKQKKKIIFIVFIIILTFFSMQSFKKLIKSEFDGAKIEFYKGTPYGPIIKTQKNEVNSFYVNGSLVGSSEDLVWDEKFIHTTLSALDKPKDILYIGSSFSYQLPEILKYKFKSLDYINLDETTIRLAQETVSGPQREKINFIVTDPRKYLQTNSKKYDCIILNKSAPASLSLNRFFTYEFFKIVDKRLKKGGIISFHFPSKRDILSPHILKFNSSILNTLDKVFKNKLLVPSDSMIVIASNQDISSQLIFSNFSQREINTDYLTIYHLKDYLAKNRRDYIENKIDPAIGINKDYYPLGFLYYLSLQQAKFYPQIFINVELIRSCTVLFFILLGLFLGVFSLKSKKANYLISIFAVGFSSIMLTAFIFIIFQVNCGALFEMIGILTGLFMLGLAGGSFFINKILTKFGIRKLALSFYFGAWALANLILWLGMSFYNQFHQALLFLYFYSFVSGVLTGAAYPLLSFYLVRDYQAKKTIPVSLYAADLSGSFLGTLLVSIFIIPFLGVWVGLGLLGCFFILFCLRNFY